MAPQAKTRVFISFDYDHDQALKNLLIGQARHERSPFSVEDWSIKQASTAWKSDARDRIRRADQVIVICGYHTHQAVGVSAELGIAKKEEKPYFLLRGRKNGWVRRPRGASVWWDTVHPWTWDSLRTMTTEGR